MRSPRWLTQFYERATLRRRTVGKLRVPSGKLLICDISGGCKERDAIEVPAGDYWIVVEMGKPTKENPFFQRIVRRAIITNRRIDDSELIQVGKVGVDMARIVVADCADFLNYSEAEGPERIGCVSTARENRVKSLLSERFKLTFYRFNIVTARCREPINDDLKNQILAYLRSFPEYARNTHIHFYVETCSTWDRVNRFNKPFGMLPIDSKKSASLAVIESGFGDGVYPIYARRGSGGATEVEVHFHDATTEEFVNSFAVLNS
ncbi:hypothetical protein [Lacipirellula limnantheis]|uniref:Uncharacterized protein n=1 Tax=Lacipirellula limnantheis TaxID=2528024 RepID=A0A517U3N4_9BACT|nr:hypothetical protein [Lacipirellula limnantheis]QDT75238.1 hypothetical protein I41_44480 [Lacipirellula limnantheis]